MSLPPLYPTRMAPPPTATPSDRMNAPRYNVGNDARVMMPKEKARVPTSLQAPVPAVSSPNSLLALMNSDLDNPRAISQSQLPSKTHEHAPSNMLTGGYPFYTNHLANRRPSEQARLPLTTPHSNSLPSIAGLLEATPISSGPSTRPIRPAPIVQPNGDSVPVHTRPVAAGPPSEKRSFNDKVQSIVRDPCFAFIIKHVLLIGNAREIDFVGAREGLEDAEAELARIVSAAYGQGLEKTEATVSPWKLCFAAVWQAVAELKTSSTVHLPRTLKCVVDITKNVTNISRSLAPIACGQQAANGAKKARQSVPRSKLTDSARAALLEWFKNHYKFPYPTEDEKKALGEHCNIDLKQVDNFFGNKRMRLKRTAMKIRQDRGGAAPLISPDSEQFSSGLSPKAKWERVVLTELPTFETAEEHAKTATGRTQNIAGAKRSSAGQSRWETVGEGAYGGQEQAAQRRRLL